MREQRFESTSTNIEKRTISGALSSEATVMRHYGTEVLRHTKEAINLERAQHGIPLLFNHDPSKPIGRVDNFRLDSDGKTRGDLSFSNNKNAQDIWPDVRDDFLNGISLGYLIDDYIETKTGIEAVRWTPKEVSIVAIEADINAGVNRNDPSITLKEGNKMSDIDKKTLTAAAVEAYKTEQATRKAEINQVFENYTGQEYAQLKIRALETDTFTPDQARKELLDLVGRNVTSNTVIIQGGDESEKFTRAVQDSLLVRVGSHTDKQVISNIRQNEFFGLSMVDIARECLQRNNLYKRGMNKMQIVGEALSMRALFGVADFPDLLANTANASIQKAYEETPETWRQWASVGNLSDFKLTDRPNLSAFDDLPIVADKADYTEGSFSDLKESMQLATYGKLFRLTRQAIINDNLDGLGRIPASMARAAARTIGTLVYNVLINNALMNQDSVAVFASAHNNDNDDPLLGVTNAQIEAGILAMALQTDPSGNATLGMFPSFLIVPTSYASNARTVMAAEYEPGTAPGNLQPNPHRGLMQVVSEHRLEAETDKPWFMVADKNVSETVEVAFLDGQDSPTLEQHDPFTYDGVTFKVRIDAAAQAIDYRGMQRFSDLTPV